jgi:hypothetical protein
MHVVISCSSVAVLEAVHKAQLEGQQTIVVRFEAMDKELVLVPVKVKTGTHRGRSMLICIGHIPGMVAFWVASLEWCGCCVVVRRAWTDNLSFLPCAYVFLELAMCGAGLA